MTRPDSHITGFVLKILAIVGMTTNHIASVLGPQMPWGVTLFLHVFGGITYPTMAFLLVEGYRHTSNLRKYASRLLLFACAAQIPFTLCFGWGDYIIPKMNVLFTLAIALAMIWALDHLPKWQSFLVFIGGVAVSYFCDWALSGPILAYLFYILSRFGTRGILLSMAFVYLYTCIPGFIDLAAQVQIGIDSAHEAIAQGIASRVIIVDVAGVPIHIHAKLMLCFAKIGYAIVGYTIATIFLCRYNGKRGRSMKWFFYAYYPLHLLVIWAVKEIIVRLG